MTDSDSTQRVILGRISGLYGVKGWVKVYSETQPMSNILEYTPWYLNLAGHSKAYALKQGRVHGKGIVALLEDIADRDQASALVGAEIAINREQLPGLKQNEYYWADLIGLEVTDQNGNILGKVDHLLETGANDVLVLKGKAGQEILIPYVEGEVVKQVDLENGQILVDWDLDY